MTKINKIIPAVLLSGAMVFPVSQLSSPIIAHAYENNAYNENKDSKIDDSYKYKPDDCTPTTTYLSDIDFQKTSHETFNFDHRIGVPSKSKIIIDLTKNEYHTFDTDLLTYRAGDIEITFDFYLDDQLVQSINTNSSKDKKHVNINLSDYDAKKLTIVVSDNSGTKYNFFGELRDAKFTTYKTNYSNKKNVTVSYEDSNYKKASKTTMYLTNNYPYRYFISDRIVKFDSYSNDPVVSERPTRSVSSEYGYRRNVGRNYGDITLGCRLKYEVEKGYRTKYYYKENGECFKTKEIPFVSKTPLGYTMQYDVVSTSKVEW